MHKRENWDTKTNLGKEKVFEVRKYYDDLTLINEFFTEEFYRKNEYFHWKHYPNGEYKLEHRDYKKIKKSLMHRHLNGGLPDIRLTESNYRGRGAIMLQHEWNDKEIYDSYVREVLSSIYVLWGNDVFLSTFNSEGEELIYECRGPNASDVELVSREDHQRG